MAADARVNDDMSDLKDLEPLSKRINSASDALNGALESIQQKLNTLALGVEVWLNHYETQELDREILDGDGGRRRLRAAELGYGRLGDGWALLVRTVDYDQQWDGNEWSHTGDHIEMTRKPLLRESRQRRVQAVELIPILMDRLKESATGVINAVEKAKRIADSLK
jgi:hypothetical protein